MDAALFETTIRRLKHRNPFQPFTFAMGNGERLEIDHPDALAIRGSFVVFAAPGGFPTFFDHTGVNHIVGDLAGRPAE